MNEEEIEKHSEFLAEFAEHCVYMATGDANKAERMHDFTFWLSTNTFGHAVKHCLERQNGGKAAKSTSKPYTGMGNGQISTTEDIQRKYAESEKKRIYEGG